MIFTKTAIIELIQQTQRQKEAEVAADITNLKLIQGDLRSAVTRIDADIRALKKQAADLSAALSPLRQDIKHAQDMYVEKTSAFSEKVAQLSESIKVVHAGNEAVHSAISRAVACQEMSVRDQQVLIGFVKKISERLVSLFEDDSDEVAEETQPASKKKATKKK